MADPTKFTAKEVLNKVLLDSSGNAVSANSVTSQEALSMALDATNNRLNVALEGGTISGDVTIAGDLTVSGGGSLSFDEILEGTQVIDVTNTEAFLVRKNGDGGDIFTVDTTNEDVAIGGTLAVVTTTNSDVSVANFQSAIDANGEHSIIRVGHSSKAAHMGLLLNSSDTAYFGIDDNPDDGNGIYVDESANVAIGDKLPLARLHVQGSSSGAVQAFIINTNGGTNSSADLAFGNWSGAIPTGTGNPGPQAKISAINTDSGTAATDLVFSTYGSATLGEYMRITSAGNVGIGVAPTEKLSIFGGVGSPATSGTSTNGNLAIESSNGNSLYIGSYSGSPFGVWLQTANYTNQAITYPLILNPNGGDVGIGTTSPNVRLGQKLDISASNNYGGMSINSFSTTDGHAPTIDFNKSGNATIGSHTVVADGEGLGNIFFRGSDGDSYENAVAIRAFVDGTPGSSDMPGRLEFHTSADGSATALVRMIIDGNSRISLSNNDSNSGNTVFGKSAFNAGSDNGSDNNTAFGELAMGTGAVSSSLRNGAFGHRALTDITSGSSNQAFGYDAATSLTIGQFNAAFGTNALYSETIGDRTTAIGESALYSQVSDSNNETTGNVGVGFTASYYNITGQNNTAVGYSAMLGASGNSHSDNTGVGFESLKAVTTGDSNVAIGKSCLTSLTSGDANVAIGMDALGTATTAEDIVAIGKGAAFAVDNDTADGTIAIGKSALVALTSGTKSTAVGFEALKGNTIGHENTAFGYNALMTNVDGDSNTAIGGDSLKIYEPADGVGQNTALGFQSGDALVTGSANTLIGFRADTDDNAGVNQTVIGSTAQGQADNSVTLGNADVTAVYMAQDSGATVHCAGIKFDASGEVLGDYEEGEHTTAITGATSGSWVLDSAQNKLSYTKIGRMVTVQGKFETDSGSGAGSLKISLPFAAADLSVGSAISVGSITINRYGSTSIPRQITPIIFEGNDFVNVQIHSTDGTSNESYLQANDIDAIFEGQLTITYIAA